MWRAVPYPRRNNPSWHLAPPRPAARSFRSRSQELEALICVGSEIGSSNDLRENVLGLFGGIGERQQHSRQVCDNLELLLQEFEVLVSIPQAGQIIATDDLRGVISRPNEILAHLIVVLAAKKVRRTCKLKPIRNYAFCRNSKYLQVCPGGRRRYIGHFEVKAIAISQFLASVQKFLNSKIGGLFAQKLGRAQLNAAAAEKSGHNKQTDFLVHATLPTRML